MHIKKVRDVCSLLHDAIIDEIDAQKFYETVKQKLNKDDRWKISEIQAEEHIHQQELKAMSNRLKCQQ